MGNTTLLDSMLGALTDPFEGIHMGVTAENVAERYGISREDQDALALESQQRAAHAISEGRFASQIVPVELRSRKGTTLFEVDEPCAAMPSSRIWPAEARVPEGRHGDGGQCLGINDGAGAVVLASEEAVKRHNLTAGAPRSYGHAGVEPSYGHRPGARLAQRAGQGRAGGAGWM
jgi:acetyl-CoA C-acetyltransferase